jgi:NADPH-dependent ferric siderophore reductase
MVKPIKKDHRGLCLSDPFLHGEQSQITEVENTGVKKTMKKLPGEEKREITVLGYWNGKFHFK